MLKMLKLNLDLQSDPSLRGYLHIIVSKESFFNFIIFQLKCKFGKIRSNQIGSSAALYTEQAILFSRDFTFILARSIQELPVLAQLFQCRRRSQLVLEYGAGKPHGDLLRKRGANRKE